MNLIMFTERPARDLAPGDLVMHKHGPMVIDEVRQTLDGVDAYGRDPLTAAKQRRRAHYGPGEMAEVLPSPHDALSVWSQIMFAVDHQPRGELDAPQQGLAALDPAPAPTSMCSLGETDGEILVMIKRQVWSVRPVLPEIEPGPAEPE